MINEIDSWISGGCNYLIGLSLLEKYSNNFFLVRILKSAESAANLERMAAELNALRETAKIEQPKLHKPTSVPSPVQSPPAQASPRAEPVVLKIKRDIERTGAEIRGLQAMLYSHEPGDKLGDIAKRLVRMSKEHGVLWTRYNYLTEHPDEVEPEQPSPPPPVMIDAQLLDQQERLRKSISKANSRLKKQQAKGKQKQYTIDLIKARQAEKDELDKRIARIRREAAE